MSNSETLLREAVRGMLQEIGPEIDYGPSFSDVFAAPAEDSLKVIGSELAKLSSKAQAAAAILIKGTVGLFLPGLEADYDRIFEAEEKRHADIMARYPDAYRNVEGAMEKAWRLPFLIDPAKTLSTQIAVKAPRAAIATARVIAGRDLISPQMRKKVKQDRELASLWRQISETRHRRNGRILVEEATPEIVQAFLSHETIAEAINNSQMAQRMHRDGISSTRQTAQELVKKTKDYLQVDSIDDIEQKMGRSVDLAPAEEAPEETDAILNITVSQVREEGKKEAIKALQERLDAMGKDNEGPVKDIYTQAVTEITKL